MPGGVLGLSVDRHRPHKGASSRLLPMQSPHTIRPAWGFTGTGPRGVSAPLRPPPVPPKTRSHIHGWCPNSGSPHTTATHRTDDHGHVTPLVRAADGPRDSAGAEGEVGPRQAGAQKARRRKGCADDVGRSIRGRGCGVIDLRHGRRRAGEADLGGDGVGGAGDGGGNAGLGGRGRAAEQLKGARGQAGDRVRR
jgi:hypothetical protein